MKNNLYRNSSLSYVRDNYLRFLKGISVFVAAIALVVGGFFVANLVLAAGPASVDLGSAANFVILTKTGITNVPTSVITGNIGTSPITGASITGLGCAEVTGIIYTVNEAGPACRVVDPTLLTAAISGMEIAYTNAAGRTLPNTTELGAGDISGLTIAPGLHKWSTDVDINTDVTLSGGANDVWIFQIAGDLNIASGGSVPTGIKVILAGGAQAKNIFWQVGASNFGATLGTYSTFNGTILSAKQVIIQTGAVLNGRALADSQVTLDANTVMAPTEAPVPSSDKDITSFSFPVGTAGVITGTDIAVTVPFGTIVTALTPTIAITGTSVSPSSGTANDFTSLAVLYRVTAADTSTQDYTVTVTVAPAGPVFIDANVNGTPDPGEQSFTTIQAAVNMASSGDTVHVTEGTYPEQVTINKSLDLIGDGETITTILAPDVWAGSVTQVLSDRTIIHDYLLAAYALSGTVDVRVQGFTLDVNSKNKTSGTGQMDGVFFRDVKNASGTVAGLFSSTIHNFAPEATPAIYEGFGVVVYGDSLLTLNDNDISDYTRDGISINRKDGAGSTNPNVTISNNTVTGTISSLNGISVDTVTAGAVMGNTITGNLSGTPWASGGIVIWASTGVPITGNHVDGNFYGIDLYNGSHDITISGNELTGNIKRGISLGGDTLGAHVGTNNNTVSGNTITGPVGGTDDVGISIDNVSTGNMIGGPTPADGNTITTAMTGPSDAMRRGIWLYCLVGPGNTIQYNTVTVGGYAGIVIDGLDKDIHGLPCYATGQKVNKNYVHDSAGGGFAINAQTAEFNYNRSINNGFGIEMGAAGAAFVLHNNSIADNDSAGTACALYGVCNSGLSVYDGTADATNNYWGAASGPAEGAVSAKVDYRPWLLGVGGTKTYDETIALTSAGQWALVSAPKLLSGVPAVINDGTSSVALLVYEGGAFVSPEIGNGDIIKPVSAFYVKTTNKGGVGFNYAVLSDSDPTTFVSKQLTTGWNLVGIGNIGTGKPVNEFSTIIKTNDSNNKGVITLNVPTTYNLRKDIGGVWGGAIGNIDISNWANDIGVLNPYGGYWVYTNADRTYLLIQ